MAVLEQLSKLTDEHFLAIYEALSENGFGPLDGEVAKALRFRPQAIRKLPMTKRAAKARRLIEGPKNADLAYELFGTYLVKTKKELVTGFLDATGVKHDDGMIEDVDATPPAEDKIATAISELDGKFEPADVTLYLSLCVDMWPGSEELPKVWRAR